MTKIQTKIFNYGNEKESTWPPLFGTRKSGVSYYDKDEGCVKEGFPPQKQKRFGEAPYIISDTIEPYYHPAAEKFIESKSKLRRVDEDHGTITTDKMQPADPSRQNALNKARREDVRKSLMKAVAQVDSGTAPLTEEVREMCKRTNKIVTEASNRKFDAFNVAGRKNGKRRK